MVTKCNGEYLSVMLEESVYQHRVLYMYSINERVYKGFINLSEMVGQTELKS